jgi:hypothetical protein
MCPRFKGLMCLCLFTVAMVAGVFWISNTAGGVLVAILFVGAIIELTRQIREDNKNSSKPAR